MSCVNMMDIVNAATCLCTFVEKHTVNIVQLRENLDTLEASLTKLSNLIKDVDRKVKLAEEQLNLARTPPVAGWLDSAQHKETKVKKIIERGKEELRQRCLDGNCPLNCYYSYFLAEEVRYEIAAVDILSQAGNFTVVAAELPTGPVEKRPMPMAIGLEKKLEMVWSCLVGRRNVNIIGICGISGIGKTILLTMINNSFLTRDHQFHFVKWISIPKQSTNLMILELLANKLNIIDVTWATKDEDEKATTIYNVLIKKKFVLLLDDVQSPLDFRKLGLSFPTNHDSAKVIFATQSRETCLSMKPQEILELVFLSPEVSLELFKKSLGDKFIESHPELEGHIKTVADLCKGWPVVLTRIAVTMASKSPGEWDSAIEKMKEDEAVYKHREEPLFSRLKFTYEDLPDDIQKCFLYCSLFPENYSIRKDELIRLWIAEGFLNKFNNLRDAFHRGGEIIGSLKHMRLLENGDPESEDGKPEDYVEMHDMIRGAALWIAKDQGKKILAEKRANLIKADGLREWTDAVRVSLWGTYFKAFAKAPNCPKLQTLLVRRTKIKTLPTDFFKSMEALTVLDLSDNSFLTNLSEEIGHLGHLHHLDLSFTNITELPIGVKKLVELKNLLMNGMNELRRIPPEVISSLESLQAFSMVRYAGPSLDEKSLIEELESLEYLRSLGIALRTLDSIQRLCSSPDKLESCVNYLLLNNCSNLPGLGMARMQQLERLEIKACLSLTELKLLPDEDELGTSYAYQGNPATSVILDKEHFRGLQHVEIEGCPTKDLTWLVSAPKLKIVKLTNCTALVKVIDNHPNAFSKLEVLALARLPNLVSICDKAMPFPSLVSITVFACPSLCKLPLDSKSARFKLKEIRGHDKWWDNLEWEDESVRHFFRSKFVRY